MIITIRNATPTNIHNNSFSIPFLSSSPLLSPLLLLSLSYKSSVLTLRLLTFVWFMVTIIDEIDFNVSFNLFWNFFVNDVDDFDNVKLFTICNSCIVYARNAVYIIDLDCIILFDCLCNDVLIS